MTLAMLLLSLTTGGCGKERANELVVKDPGMDWVEILPGTFTFGSPDDTPCRGPYTEKQIQVTLTHPFVIARTELTQKQWAAMALPVPKNMPACDNCPIQYVNFFDALAWCNALSRFEGLEECYDLSSCVGEVGTGCDKDVAGCNAPMGAYYCDGRTRKYESMYDCKGYRLPTVSEWEYAAKAGTTTNTYNGDITDESDGICVNEPILDDIGWYCDNSGVGNDAWSLDMPGRIKEVAGKAPNPWGLYDILGNAMEWTDYVYTGWALDDVYGDSGGPLTDPMGPEENADTRRVLRGGVFLFVPCYIRSAANFPDMMDNRGPGYGFRPVRTLPSPDAGPDAAAR